MGTQYSMCHFQLLLYTWRCSYQSYWMVHVQPCCEKTPPAYKWDDHTCRSFDYNSGWNNKTLGKAWQNFIQIFWNVRQHCCGRKSSECFNHHNPRVSISVFIAFSCHPESKFHNYQYLQIQELEFVSNLSSIATKRHSENLGVALIISSNFSTRVFSTDTEKQQLHNQQDQGNPSYPPQSYPPQK